METLKIECKILRDKLYNCLATNLHLLVQAQLTADQSKMDPHKIISTICHYNYEELFDHTDLTNEELNLNYKKIHGLATFRILLTKNPPTEDTAESMLQDTSITQPEDAQ